MNLTKLFALTLTITFITSGSTFADENKPVSKPETKGVPQKPSVRQTEPGKVDRSRYEVDPATRETWSKANTWFIADRDPFDRLLRDAKSCYHGGKLDKAEHLANEAIEFSIKLSGNLLRDARYSSVGLTQRFSGQARGLQRDARLLIGRIRMKQGFYNEALQIFRADWRENSDKRVDLDIALCFARSGNDAMARKFAPKENLTSYLSDDVLTELPDTGTSKALEARIVFARGAEAFMRSEYQEAFANFKTASQMFPDNGVLAYYTGKMLTELKRNREAIVYYRIAMQRLDGNSRLLADAKEREQGAVYFKSIGQ